MKPPRSWATMMRLPSRSPKARVWASVSSLVAMLRTSSRSFITGGGLKKWVPITRSARRVARAISMIGREEVLLARMVCSGVIRSSRWKTSTLSVSRSAIASMTMSQPSIDPRSRVKEMRSRMAETSSSLSLPVARPRSSDLSTRRRAAASASASCSDTWVLIPCRAQTSAIPDPIRPPPTIPTVLIAMPSSQDVLGAVPRPRFCPDASDSRLGRGAQSGRRGRWGSAPGLSGRRAGSARRELAPDGAIRVVLGMEVHVVVARVAGDSRGDRRRDRRAGVGRGGGEGDNDRAAGALRSLVDVAGDRGARRRVPGEVVAEVGAVDGDLRGPGTAAGPTSMIMLMRTPVTMIRRWLQITAFGASEVPDVKMSAHVMSASGCSPGSGASPGRPSPSPSTGAAIMILSTRNVVPPWGAACLPHRHPAFIYGPSIRPGVDRH